MHSQLPTISLYLNSYARSPVKYTNESTLMASPHKNRMTAVDSSIISPLKDQLPTLDRNLSSLILMASPAKPPPPKEREEREREDEREGEVEVRALNLSANIFMNSTTKFLKTFANPNNQSTSANIQQKKSSSNQRNNVKMGGGKQQNPNFDQNSSKIMPLGNRYVKSTEAAAPIAYPSKEKIEKLMKGESNKKMQGQNNGSLMIRKTLSRNRGNSSQSNVNPNRNESLSERSRSGSVQRLERRKSRTRELKFMEKKERSQTSITLKQTQKDLPAKIDIKTRNNIRPIVNEAKSAGNKRTEETVRTNTRNNNVRPLPYTVPADKNMETTPSILSNISEPRVTAKREGFKPIFTLPSGELPLETPIKPPPPLQRNQSNKSNDPTFKPANKAKPQLVSQISAIKQEKTSDVYSKPSVKSKQLVFHGSVKEEASTYVHENPTEVVAAGNDGAVSKLSKNQSTKAIGLSTVFRNYNNKNVKQQLKVEESRNEPSKPVVKKTQSSKFIPLEPIPSSPSILSDRRSPLASAVSKRNIKTEPKDDLSSKIVIQEPSAINKDNEQAVSKKTKSSTVLLHVITKWLGRRLRDGLQEIKQKGRSSNRHGKEGAILVKETASIYRFLYISNLRSAIGQLKKVSLSNPINKKPNASLNTYKPNAASIIFRVLTSKYRESVNSFKNSLKRTQALPVISNQPTKTNIPPIQNKTYVLQQFQKILQGYNKSKAKNSFEKLMLFSISKKKGVQKQPIPATRSISKIAKPLRDYQSQKTVLNNDKQAIQSDVSRIQWRISEKKRYSNQEKGKLIKKQQDWQSKNKALDEEVIDRRQKNKSLKLIFQQSAQMREIDTSLPECESFVDILTQIYSSIFRSKDQTIDANKLIEKYSLSKEYQSPIQQQWKALVLNTVLKSSIGQWQGHIPPHRPKQLLLSEQSLIAKVLRSYVRERYLWQYFHSAAESLLPSD